RAPAGAAALPLFRAWAADFAPQTAREALSPAPAGSGPAALRAPVGGAAGGGRGGPGAVRGGNAARHLLRLQPARLRARAGALRLPGDGDEGGAADPGGAPRAGARREPLAAPLYLPARPGAWPCAASC